MKALALIWWQWLVGHARGIWNAPAPSWTLPPVKKVDAATLEQQVRRGREARSLWDNQVFAEAATAVHMHLANERRRVPMSDHTMHTRLIIAEQVFGRLLDGIQQVMMTGELANQQIVKAQGTSDRIRQAFRRGLRA